MNHVLHEVQTPTWEGAILRGKQANHCKLECGPMPNVMDALPNIGGAVCSTPQRLADAHYLTAVH